MHRSTWSLIERGYLDRLTVATLRRCLAVLEIRLELRPSWRGPQLDRLLDEAHASLQAAWADRLRRWDWDVRLEVSFNHYGDRGRIDLFAWHARTRSLLVGEVKTELVDVQDTLGALDTKVRVARHVTQTLGWAAPQRVVPLLVLRDSSTVRNRLRRLGPAFSAFPVRGRKATTCLRHPEQLASPLLILSDLRNTADSRVKQLGTFRVRLAGAGSSVDRRVSRETHRPDPLRANPDGNLQVGSF